MSDESNEKVFRIDDSPEGYSTLVAQLSFLQVDKIIQELVTLRQGGTDETKIRDYLSKRAHDMDAPSRDKLYQLSQGQLPPDDFERGDCTEYEQVNDVTLKVRMNDASHTLNKAPMGSVVFHGGQRNVLVYEEEGALSLKRF